MLPTFEEIEIIFPVNYEFAAMMTGKKNKAARIDTDACYCLSAGEKGRLRLWNLKKMGEVGVDSFPIEKSMVAPSRKIDTIHVENRQLYIAQDDTIGKIILRNLLMIFPVCGGSVVEHQHHKRI